MTERRNLTESEKGAFIVMRWMLMGGRVESSLSKFGIKPSYTFLLDEDKNLCVAAVDSNGEELLLRFHGDFFYIAEIVAESIGPDGVSAIAANIALNMLNEKEL